VTSAIGLLTGLLLGLWATRRLWRQTQALLHQTRGARSVLTWGWLLRLIAIATVFALLVAWSAVAALSAIIGYWFGRTMYLVKFA